MWTGAASSNRNATSKSAAGLPLLSSSSISLIGSTPLPLAVHLALFDRGLNLRRRMRLDFDHRPRDLRREDRTQVLLADEAGSRLPGFRGSIFRRLLAGRFSPL